MSISVRSKCHGHTPSRAWLSLVKLRLAGCCEHSVWCRPRSMSCSSLETRGYLKEALAGLRDGAHQGGRKPQKARQRKGRTLDKNSQDDAGQGQQESGHTPAQGQQGARTLSPERFSLKVLVLANLSRHSSHPSLESRILPIDSSRPSSHPSLERRSQLINLSRHSSHPSLER